MIVDNFAGGGGASVGIQRALGRAPNIAVNHDFEAVAMHQANHPHTRHLCGDVWDVDPKGVCGGEPVELSWFSPDCKHFSRAKGGRPVERKVRALAWVVIRWAREVAPRVILLENVPEFLGWGPLGKDGRPDATRRGSTYRRWLAQLEGAGYVVETRLLRACDFGAPTSRQRLFLVARRDGKAIVWPEPTHGPGRAHPYRTAAHCIDWGVECPSIFERAKPLAEKTLRRIVRGMERFVIGAARPFIIPTTHAGDLRVHSVHEPMRTITGAHRGELALAVPTLVQTGYGERPGQAPRVPGLHRPMGTVVAGGAKHALVVAFIAKGYGGHETPGAAASAPMSTITTKDHHALVMCTTRRGHAREVRELLRRYASNEKGVAGAGTADIVIEGQNYRIGDIGMRMLTPRELARAQGFPDDYVLDPIVNGKPLTKTAQIRMVGNSVSPPVAAAIVAANLGALDQEHAA